MGLANLARQLHEAGTPIEGIILALEAVEAREAVLTQQRAREAERTRRYRERGGGQIPEEMRQEVFARDGFACVDCSAVDHLQCDHIHPVSKGGETTLANLQTLCRPCNARKKDRVRKRDVRGHSADNSPASSDSPDATPSLDKSPQTPKINPNPGTHGEGAPAHTRGAAWACPGGVDPQHWRDFRANRRKKKLSDTETSFAGQLRLLERFACDEWPPGKLVEKAAEKGWGTIVDPSEYEAPRNGQRPANDHRGSRRRADEIDDAYRELGFGG